VTSIDWTSSAMGSGQYAEVNGINLYYETHGAGQPMMLLHGGLASSEMFGPILPTLADHHQVIAVDLQGHGRTGDIDRPIELGLIADDIAALIDHLGLDGQQGQVNAAAAEFMKDTPMYQRAKPLWTIGRPSTRG
jgi:pimeloyl-ACP methyl ester carboxylesterase